MKTLFLLLTLTNCIFLFPVFAQPVITSSAAPEIGDVIKIDSVDGTGLLQGPAGVNQTWDFSNVGSTGTATITYMSPTATPYSSSYPLASIASNDGSSYYSYFSISSSEEDSLGEADSAVHFCYNNAEKTFSYPFTYNDSFTDTFSGPGNNSYPFLRKGTITVKADGYGTLKTPAGTFTNVLRISRKENIIDTFFILHEMFTYANQMYLWYINGFSNTLFTLAFDTTYFTQSKLITPVAYYSTNVPNGVSNITAPSFNVFPNPATDKIFVNATNPIRNVALLNVLGQSVIEQPDNNTGNNHLEISIADLPPGIYFCNVTTPVGNAVRRIVKE